MSHRNGQWCGVIFDLDGTLWDATVVSARGWSAGLRQLGVREQAITGLQIAGVAGLPYADCVRKILPDLPDSELPRVLEALNHHERTAIGERAGTLYPGVEEGLATLSTQVPLMLVSNCQQWYLEAFFRHYPRLHALFKDSECHGRTGRSKGENLAAVAARSGLDPKRTAYVGDTWGDARAARAAELRFAYVTYGFGGPTAVTDAPPEWRFEDFPSLVRAFSGI